MGKVPRGTSPEVAPAGTVAEGLSDFMDRWVMRDCPGCGRTYHHLKDAPATDTCAECRDAIEERARIDREFSEITANRDRWLDRWLEKAGMSRRERTATSAGIPAYLRSSLERVDGYADLIGGRVPAHGFGISGTAGTGKTMALSAVFRECVHANWYRRGQVEGRKALNLWLGWARWPETVNKWRLTSMEDGGIRDVERDVHRLAELDAVVIDDIGGERIKGDYTDDWATSQLDLLIDRRYNAMKPTWFTTNLSVEDFAGRYGARLFSRLLGDSPLVRISTQHPDLRVVRGKP